MMRRSKPSASAQLPVYNQKALYPSIDTENDEMTDALQTKVHSLKSLTIEIESELRAQNELLLDAGNDFLSGEGFLANAINKVRNISQIRYHRYLVYYLLLFIFFVMSLLWILLKFSK